MGETKLTDESPDQTTSPQRNLLRDGLTKKSISHRFRQAETKTTRHAKRFIFGRIESLRSAREHIIAWFIAVGVVLAAILGQFLLSNSNDVTQASIRGGTYAEGVVGDIRSLNPLYATTSAEVALSKLIFSSLYRYDQSGALHRDIASDIDIDKEASNYTVTLRRDATWQDGAPVTADDVVYTVETIKNPESRTPSSLQNNWNEVEVSKIDDYTVKFTLPSYAAFPHALTFPILPSHLLADVHLATLDESDFSQFPVGSGPFSFKLFQNAETVGGEKVVHLVANTEYYEGAPMVNRFELHAYQNRADLVRALADDELSAATDVKGADVLDINEKRYIKTSQPINNGVYALMNNSRGVFASKNIRKAVQLSLDMAAVRGAAGDDVPELYLPFMPYQVASAKLPSRPAQDIQKAKSLLAKDKWKLVDGVLTKKGESLSFTITTIKDDQYERVANEVARQLRDLGMQVQISVIDVSLPNSNFVGDVLQRRNFEMLVYELQIGADPDVYAYWHSSQLGNTGYNFTSYENDIADAALVSARDRLEFKLRDAKYALFAKQWLIDAPAIGLYQQSFVYLRKPSTNSIIDESRFVSPSDRYTYVQNWTVNKGDVYKTP